eukprot:gene3790-4733_t
MLIQKTHAAAYQWHNYGKSTIGARSDVEQVSIPRLQAFYRTWYQPDNATLVVSGHYDSRNSDVMDSLGEAPGANDDASGTAAVMELACVMARRQFDATVVFMTVPGEEQGLLGAAQWAREARAANTNVEAMITNDIIGSSRGDAGQQDARRLRLFADGLDPLVR